MTARESTQGVLSWYPQNIETMTTFAGQLMGTLTICFVDHNKVKVTKEKMWEQYNTLRSTKEFADNWAAFLKLSKALPSQILYQHITDIVFNHLIKEYFTLPESTQAITSTQTLDYNERNALRYVTGYISRTLYCKLKDSKHGLKDELCLRIAELNDVVPDELSDKSNEWMIEVDRGGLTHVTNMTYMTLESAEVEFRKNIVTHGGLNTAQVKDTILQNDDVQFYWDMVSTDWEQGVTTTLLEMFVDEYLKIRGHSTASAFMEKYKVECKKSLQKSKGVRKQLLSKSASATTTTTTGDDSTNS